MKTNCYIQSTGDYGMTYLEPIEKFKLTGRWKVDTLKKSNGSPPPGYEGDWPEFKVIVTLSIERQFGIFPWWKIWENENNFVFREEESIINDCGVLSGD